MNPLKIAITQNANEIFNIKTYRELVLCNKTDYIDVACFLATPKDAKEIAKVKSLGFGIPIILILDNSEIDENSDLISDIEHVINNSKEDNENYNKKIEHYASIYEKEIQAPFFRNLKKYCLTAKNHLSTPAHAGGAFFDRHPAGRLFKNFYGENLFRADLSSSDIEMGDVLLHQGPVLETEKLASKVFNSNETFFVLSGSSGSNKIVMGALLTPGDIILYDRNNHKSVCNAALVEQDAIPIFLETARNSFGSIGGILNHCFDEDYIRGLIKEKAPEKASLERPIRVAVIQLGTYDGIIYNSKQVVEKIGKLCEYICFDSAWVGYEQFVPIMKDCSPLLLDLKPSDPGIFVVQSVHKQLAGLSQASQIHKKDLHIKDKPYYINHKILNNSFLKNTSTSPNYAILTSLDVNARMHANGCGEKLWSMCLRVAIDARKLILKKCKYFKPFIPPIVDGKKWEDVPTEEIMKNRKYFALDPNEKWHSFKGFDINQYFVDPFKLLILTPGIDVNTESYQETGINANILMAFLHKCDIIPEKCDTNTILFLLTPAVSMANMQDLIYSLVKFEKLYDENQLLREIFPKKFMLLKNVYYNWTIRDLCQKMHNLYKERNVFSLQKKLFLKEYFPKPGITAQKAYFELLKNHGEIVAIKDIEGRIALEGALPYPPGITCVLPGERWTAVAIDYFLALLDGINECPGFEQEIQGVYLERNKENNKLVALAYVLKKEYEPK